MAKYVSNWRKHAAPIIARVLSETAGKPEKEIRKALREAFPFGVYGYHPLKIWLDEIRIQRGLKKLPLQGKGIVRQPESTNGQTEMFARKDGDK